MPGNQTNIVYELGYLHAIRQTMTDLRHRDLVRHSPKLEALALSVEEALVKLNTAMLLMAEGK